MSDSSWKPFENRKADHIRLALDERTQTTARSHLDRVELLHEALPELDFSEVHLRSSLWGHQLQSPIFVSSMTSGHREGEALNERLAVACARHGWMLGCGSQRRELTDPDSHREWVEIKQKVPELRLMGNLGLSQLVKTPIETVQALVDRLGLVGFFIHTNPLQECLQPEGSPQFRGGLDALRRLCVNLSVPVVLKETGSGFSMATLRRLKGLGLAAVDVSGLGGTHWGRVEGLRADPNSAQASAGHTFGDWGTSTVESLLNGRHVHADYELWASGGVRTGLDVAKLLAMGARRVGVAQPILRAALMGVDELSAVMEKMDFELRVALFCTGSASVDELREKKQWRWR